MGDRRLGSLTTTEDIDEEAPTGDTDVTATYPGKGGGGAYCMTGMGLPGDPEHGNGVADGMWV